MCGPYHCRIGRVEVILLTLGLYTIVHVIYLNRLIELGSFGKRMVDVLQVNKDTTILLTALTSTTAIQVRGAEELLISAKTNLLRPLTSTTAIQTRTAPVVPIAAETNHTCPLPELIQYGIPWPNCLDKLNWLKHNWKKDKCYAELGVTDNQCSMLEYLSTKENHCPPVKYRAPTLEKPYFGGVAATPRTNFTYIYNALGSTEDYAWIKKRIESMESMWIENAKLVFTEASTRRTKKRIHLHLGLMALGLGKNAFKGGPLGELVQWGDLISALHVMGHDVILTRSRTELISLYPGYKRTRKSSCPTINSESKVPFDIIYTDIRGYKEMQRSATIFGSLRCRVRIVDSFGTEAAFNHLNYQIKKRLKKSQYSGLDLNPQQFNTMFPHTPDNTFLGFVTEFAKKEENTPSNVKRDIALVYGKEEKFWEGKEKYIDTVKEYVSEVHSTVHSPKQLQSYIVNHGVVNSSFLGSLLERTKIFVGLGFPYEGPAPLEAIQSGAVFLNPFFRVPLSSLNNKFYSTKPTRRKITSQNPYAEKIIGKPHVYTVVVEDEKALRSTLEEISNATDPGPFLSHEFSVRGMLERVSVQIEKQQFCVLVPYSPSNSKDVEDLRWPPLSALKIVLAENAGKESCNEVCEKDGLLCEPSFFPILNRKEAFESIGLVCNKTEVPTDEETDYPAHDKDRKICYLQKNPLLFSCADNYKNMQRLCPCRDYKRTQVALCGQCGMN